MKTTFTLSLFAAVAFSFLLYSCQKEETIKVATPNKPVVTTPVVVVDNPTPDKPITNNPNTPTPTSPSNPNHPPYDPNVTVSNSASCFNCHRRIGDVEGAAWSTGFGVDGTTTGKSPGGLSIGTTTKGE